MQTRSLALGAIGAFAFAATTSAAVITFSQQNVWSAYAAFQNLTVVTEDFSGIADGFYPAPVSGNVGGINWTGGAAGGLFADSGFLSTNNPTSLTFVFSPGVQAVAGNFFGTDFDFNAVPSLVQVTLADGTSSILFTTGPSDFSGFFSTGAAISSLTVTAAGQGAVYPTVDNLYFAVPIPAPGAAALIGLAAVATRRRRDIA
jgi:hypothetical protein